jgi:hypothetical protein
LLIASVDKAKEMGIDWWTRSPFLTSSAPPELPAPTPRLESEVAELKKRLARLEAP